MYEESFLDEIRTLRGRSDLKLKPNPYLKEEVIGMLRPYQAVGLMNLLMQPHICLGDDTGLGKTLQVLASISYIWHNEPEFIPIVVTTKSAIYQWSSETKKFMSNMTTIVVDGNPAKRQEIYDEFFSVDHRVDPRVILIISYDSLARDVIDGTLKTKTGKDKEIRKEKEELKSEIERLTSLMDFTGENKIKEIAVLKAKLQKLTASAVKTSKTRGLMSRLQGLKDDGHKFFLVLDEIHRVKNYRSQIHEKVRFVSTLCDRVVGLTATPVKNRLIEFFGLYRIIEPKLFPKVMTFQNDYCVMKLQTIGGGRKVPIIVGYKNLKQFVSKIEPYYLSRKKHDVAKDLPSLISSEVDIELSSEQQELYSMAEAGLLDQKEYETEESTAEALSKLVRCQQAVNHPELLKDDDGNSYLGKSGKVSMLLDMLENDLADRKTILFTRFETFATIVAREMDGAGIKYVRITGKENDPKVREASKVKFQDLESGVNVIIITLAGSESLNLQAAEHFVFLDLPWSFGDYVQLIGRMIRIGSSHNTVVAHHFLARKQDGGKTIDHHVLRALQSKQKLADQVAGKNLVGGLSFKENDMVRDLYAAVFGAKKDGTKKV